MPTPFEIFVNSELPKRPFTDDGATTWAGGKPLVSTGIGLGVEEGDFPLPPVVSVNGVSGAVVLTPSDIGAVSTLDVGATNGVAELVDGVIPTSRLPALAINEYLGDVGTEAAMLALIGQKGDWCTRTDLGLAYVVIGDTPSQLSSWKSWPYPLSSVISINGQTGIVVLGAADVGADASGAATSAVSTHVAASDPHGDRAYAASQAASAVSTHVAASDPHGDRAYASSLFGAFYDPTKIVERITRFYNGVDTTSLAPYSLLHTSSTYTQATHAAVTAITGYRSAVSGSWILTQNTGSTVQASLVYGLKGSNGGGKHDTIWSTGDTMQTMIHASLLYLLPDGSNNFEYRFGLFFNAYIPSSTSGSSGPWALDPFGNTDSTVTTDGAAAYFFVDNSSGNWRCKSGSGATVETSTTSVAAELNKMITLKVYIAANGVVTFYIDGVLVSTHNTGVITDGKQLSEGVSTMHKAAVATATKGWFISKIGFRQVLANQSVNFVFS